MSNFNLSKTKRIIPAIVAISVVFLLCATLFAQNQPRQPRQFELKAESPEFWDLISKDATLEKVAGGFGFLEGPVWDPRGGFLYVSDETGNKISKVYLDGRIETAVEVGDPDGSCFDKKGRLISTGDTIRAVIEVQPDGKYKVLADKYEGKRFNSPNDIVLGPDGALYFTDPTLDLPKGDTQEIPFTAVYRLGADGSVKLIAKDWDQPNGLAFSADGKKLYVNDIAKKEIWVFDFAKGEVSNRRLFAKEEGRGGPDGVKVDRKGNVWATGPLGVWVWNSEGKHLGTIVMPEQPANLNWGGKGNRTMFFAARSSVYRLETKADGFVPK